jgi:hypothetical protein
LSLASSDNRLTKTTKHAQITLDLKIFLVSCLLIFKDL